MARQLKKETIANLRDRHAKLLDATTRREAETRALEATKDKLTPEGIREAMSRIFKAGNEAIEHATYLGSVFGNFLTGIAEKSPERIADVFKVLETDISNIVEAINETKQEIREAAEERKNAEIRQKAEELIAKLNAAEAEKKAKAAK